MTVKHLTCGKEYNVRMSDFKKGNRCPYCKTLSKGESGIRSILSKHNINFTEQYTFSDCRSDKKRLLKFDFAIFNSDNTLKLLIEFDGSHHFNNYGREERFKDIKRRDSLKNEYCKNNNIKLIRIPYWLNVEKKLISEGIISSTTNCDECNNVES